MGRKKLWDERILLPLTADTIAEMDRLLEDGETRLDLVRYAIEMELRRRRRRS